jgi:hypothetical protein
MRKAFLISVIILSINIRLYSQAVIGVLCDDTWGPGRYNKVTITINLTGPADFARFSQDFPVGLEIMNDDPVGGDFNFVNNRINMVWMKFPPGKKLTFSYFVKPDKSMNGNFTLTGRFSVVDGRDLLTTLMKEKLISVEGTNGILPGQMKTPEAKVTTQLPMNEQYNQSVGIKNSIIFRVQVSVSTQAISEAELIKKIGLDQGTEARVIPAGKMYKYQAGSFTSYDSAVKLLREIISRGYKDAFIVAYRGSEQVPVEKALENLK